MVVIAKLIAVALTVFGCFSIMKPDMLRKLLEALRKDNMSYAAGGVKTAAGILLIAAAPACAVGWIVAVIGWFQVITGLLMLALKKGTVLGFIGRICDKPQAFYVRSGGFILGLGVVLIYAI